jgi:quinohemoprotein ethanol dehydrogenase
MACSNSRRCPTLTLAALLLLACLGFDQLCRAARSGNTIPAPDSIQVQNADNWPSYGDTSDEQRFSPLTEINAASVSRLGLLWSLDLDGMTSLEATPLAIDGTLYFTGTHAVVFAVDARSGKLLWRYDPDVAGVAAEHMRMDFGANRGAAYADGRVFVGSGDGRLIALDSRTGRKLWQVQTLPPDSGGTITGAPRVFGNKVIIGQGGAEYGFRGYATAYDTKTGRQAWRFYVVPGNPKNGFESAAMKMAAKSWSGEWWKYGGGGTPWNAITYDAELNRIYIGTGNSSPYDVKIRTQSQGDNLFLASIVALDADTGRYIWHYQVNPQEAWDYKATMDIVLADLDLNGRKRKVLMQAPTNGFFYVIDRRTGKLLSAEKIGKVTWAERVDLKTGRPVEAANIRYPDGPITMWPSTFGAHNWQAMSFNPATGLVYIPYMQLGARFDRFPNGAQNLATDTYKYRFTMAVGAEFVKQDPEDGKGSLLAWDPVANKVRWKVSHPQLWNGGTMTTAGNLVFQGTATGDFAAYSADQGRELWHFDAKLGIIAPPITYRVDGHQYVSVLVGWGGAVLSQDLMPVGWKYGAQPRRLLTFALDAGASLPPTAPPDWAVHPVSDPNFIADPTLMERGATLYFTHQCIVCHGADAMSAGIAPDLRESQAISDRVAFTAILRQGLLSSKGMPKFSELSDDDIASLRQYIESRAHMVQGGGHSRSAGP